MPSPAPNLVPSKTNTRLASLRVCAAGDGIVSLGHPNLRKSQGVVKARPFSPLCTRLRGSSSRYGSHGQRLLLKVWLIERQIGQFLGIGVGQSRTSPKGKRTAG